MNKLFNALFGVVLAGLMLSSGTAAAASLTVAIRQVNPNSAVQTVSCDLLKPNCVLPFVINAGQSTQQSVSIHVVYYNGGLALNFQTPGGYFYTDAAIGKMVLYSTLWSRPLQSSTPYQAALFQPLAPSLIGQGATSSAAHTPVAHLEITATPVP